MGFTQFPNPLANGGNSLVLYGSISGSLTFTVPSVVTTYTLVWPAAQGAVGTTLQNDGSGNLSWQPTSSFTIGTYDGTSPSANGLVFTGGQLYAQSASATVPGMVNTSTQTLAGSKTFSGLINADGGIDRSTSGTLTIGATNSNIINIGNSGATVNIQGTTIYENTPQLLTADPLITVNHGGGAGSGQNSGIEVEEAGSITGYNETSSDRNSWILKAPNTAGIATITPGVSGITINQSSHNPVTIGTANGLSLSTQVLSLALSSTSTTGALSSTDWNTFNGKQAAGNYITALTGDVTASGPGSVAATLATVNANVGSFTNAAITVNAKGLITAASSGTTGNLTDVGTDGIVITSGTGAVLGSGTSIAQHVADTTNNGYLSSTDWNTFNGKQAAGNYITALTGDATSSGPGSAALTLATVNSNVGSFGSSTSIPSFTVNAKGLITAASGNAVIAPAGTLSGTTLNATVVSSSLTSVGTIATGVWNGTKIAEGFGGTNQTTYTTGDILYASASNTLSKLAIGSTGNVLTVAAGVPSWAAPSVTLTAPTVQTFSTGSGTYTRPTSPTPLYLLVRIVGGGGGGGGVGSASGNAGGGGGGAGGYCEKIITSPASTYSYAVGALGAGGAAGGSGGSNGGNTTFSTLAGNGGQGGGGTASVTSGGPSGPGGSSSGGDINANGSAGDPGDQGVAAVNGGTSGSGGSSFFGQAGGGRASGLDLAGLAASSFGAGGGGACGQNKAGGDGASGFIIVREFYQ